MPLQLVPERRQEPFVSVFPTLPPLLPPLLLFRLGSEMEPHPERAQPQWAPSSRAGWLCLFTQSGLGEGVQPEHHTPASLPPCVTPALPHPSTGGQSALPGWGALSSPDAPGLR